MTNHERQLFERTNLFTEKIEQLENKVRQLEELVTRQGNQIQNAFDIFSKEGEHY